MRRRGLAKVRGTAPASPREVDAGLRGWIAFLLASALFLIAPVSARAESPSAKSHRHDARAIDRGRKVFNSNCAHCHGEDAAATDSYYNLPQLLADKSDAFFFHTVTHGISSKGMPAWGGILKRGQMADVLAFIRAIEKEQGITGD
jgi:mono/diheme cytochrome c family protein